MTSLPEKLNILEHIEAAAAVILPDGDVWLNSHAASLLSGFGKEDLPQLLADHERLAACGLSASADTFDGMTLYTVFHEGTALSPDSDDRHSMLDELHERNRRRELLISICLVCAYSQGTLDGVYFAVSETARLLETDCAALFVADNETGTWNSICLCTADGDNDGYSVRTDIPFDEFAAIEKKLDEKSCIILTGQPEASLISGEPSAVCAGRVSAETGSRAVLWLEKRNAPETWTQQETAYIYLLLGVLKMALRRSRMEREPKDALRDAYEANSAKSEFFSSVSHEIRTPINAILGMTSLALDSSDPTEIHSCLEKVSSSGMYLLGIINDILDISCIEAGKFTLTPANCPLGTLLDEVCGMMSFTAERKGLDFIFETDGTLPEYIFCDGQRLRQVLINLLNNAVKFTDSGYVSLHVSTGSHDGTEMLRLIVSDTGRGIAPEDHQRIFSAYERLDGSLERSTEGSGLGLRITKSIVDMMGGRIALVSEPGEGSSFTVMLPLTACEGESSADEPEYSFTAPDARLLVVDDSEVSLMVTTGMLKKFGISPDTAANGQQAFERACSSEYDMILMDHMMPVMDGETSCRRIRSSGLNIDTPIVALTANATQAAAALLTGAGMNDILTKPLLRGQLAEKLLRWLPPEMICEGADEAPAAADVSRSYPGLTVHDALERMGGNLDLYAEALSLTMRELDKALETERQLLDSGDMAALRIESHGLKGVLNTIGAYDAGGLALRLEKASAAGDIDCARSMWKEYENTIKQLSSTISRYLQDNGYLPF